ncbi:hypothetical protein [Parvibaculum sp.]|jgi:hypothetical protein|uniref:hypothetical protein n=1 Tax=Parvibaculum sp. TaxID=2024848 RepID=UPI0025F06C58|nr:hypothetical protein [Parvibaculum sp.]|tara:strand:+ start:30001 stop:30294 length:294 start_codon:yes stop_codon:yes gene_type:complete
MTAWRKPKLPAIKPSGVRYAFRVMVAGFSPMALPLRYRFLRVTGPSSRLLSSCKAPSADDLSCIFTLAFVIDQFRRDTRDLTDRLNERAGGAPAPQD